MVIFALADSLFQTICKTKERNVGFPLPVCLSRAVGPNSFQLRESSWLFMRVWDGADQELGICRLVCVLGKF